MTLANPANTVQRRPTARPEPPASSPGASRPAPWAYVAAGVISAVALTGLLRLDRAGWRVPFYYSLGGDNHLAGVWVKMIVDHGWVLDNPRIGAPGALDMRDFPMPENLHFLLVWLLGALSHDYAAALNLFYVLNFPLAAWAALFALRRLGVSATVATVVGVLYAFLPYHFLRGQGHLWLGGYYAVPLMALVLAWLWRGEPIFWKGDDPDRPRPPGRPALAAAICIAMPATGPYYAFFGACLASAGAIIVLLRRRSAPRLLDAATVLALIAGSLATQVAPTIAHVARHGRSPEVARRRPHESEQYGLKLYQLLLPAPGHRSPILRKFTTHKDLGPHDYDRMQVQESETGALGLIGAVGLVALLLAAFVARRGRGTEGLLGALSEVNLATILLATVGGFGTVFAALVSPQIRAYNRASVFVAFFSLAAVALGLEAARRRWATTPRSRAAGLGLLGALLAFGLWDQSPAVMVPDYGREARAFAIDARFAHQVEAALGDRPMVFQLPHVPFPETRPVGLMRDYDHLWGYFHTTRARWSYGAMRGREAESWQRRVAALPPVAMVAALRAAGFGGLTLDRHGFSEAEAARIEAELRRLTGSEPMVGPGGRVVFFRIPPPAS
jgi:phosphoglycerol transferase